jgi:competence protein ComEC
MVYSDEGRNIAQIMSSSTSLQIHHINVGEGDAVLIISPSGKSLLYDAGDDGYGITEILPYLASLGIDGENRKLDYTVVSHYHADHIGGYDEVIYGLDRENGTEDDLGPNVAAYDRGWYYYTEYYDDYERAANEKRATINDGDEIDMGPEIMVKCIAVNGNGILESPYLENENKNCNDFSVVLLVKYENFRYLVAGEISGVENPSFGYHDIETSVADELVGMGEVPIAVYRVSHHGSKYSSNQYLIDNIDPEVSIISDGQNSWGNPHPSVISRLEETSTVYETRFHGDIVVKSDGSDYWAEFPPEQTSEVNVYFCNTVDNSFVMPGGVEANGPTNTRTLFIERVNNARDSIDICFTGFNDSTVNDALIAAHDNGVQVRVIVDLSHWGSESDRLVAAGIPVLHDGSENGDLGLNYDMHNKFAIFDEEWVWSSSAHWFTGPDPEWPDDWVVVQDNDLAGAFTEEFELMWGDGPVDNQGTPGANSKFGEEKESYELSQSEFVINGRLWEFFPSPRRGATRANIKEIEITYPYLAGDWNPYPFGYGLDYPGHANYEVFFALSDFTYTKTGPTLINTGEFLILKDPTGEVIDNANRDGSWFAGGGSSENYRSMERIDAGGSGTTSSNWASNDGENRNGLDADENLINGTPKQPNSCSVPPSENVGVVINEIAWGGTAADYEDEWIELYNTSDSPVDLTHWVLRAQDNNPFIALHGTIPDNGYFLLERGDDDTVSDITADQIYREPLTGQDILRALEWMWNNNGIDIRGLIGNYYRWYSANRPMMGDPDNLIRENYPHYAWLIWENICDNIYPAGLHHKYGIIDGFHMNSDPCVIAGSRAWSQKANWSNDEMTLYIHDSIIVNQFLQEFAARYEEASGTPLPHPAPTLSSVDSSSGYNNVKTEITLYGDNFEVEYPIAVQIGTTYCAVDLENSTSTQLKATVPEGMNPGTYDVVVTNPSGWQDNLPAGFTVINTPPTVTFNSPSPGTIIGDYSHVEVGLELTIDDADTGSSSLDVMLEYNDGYTWRTAMDWTPAAEERESENFDPHGTGGYCYKTPENSTYQYYYFIIENYFVGEVDNYKFRVTVQDPGELTASENTGDLVKQGASVQTQTIYPSDDSWVDQASPSSTNGNDYCIEVATKVNANRRSFLRFDLSDTPADTAIVYAELRLRCYWYYNWVAIKNSVHVQVHSVADDGWTENNICWDNQPALGNLLDQIYVNGYRWFGWDVTSLVCDEYGGDNVTSFGLRVENENYDDVLRRCRFRSKEYDNLDPYLLIYTTIPAPPPTPELISPENCAFIVDNTPTFMWSAVYDPSGVTYDLQVDNNLDFSSPEIDVSDLSENTHTVPDNETLSGNAYYWRVRAVDGADNPSGWSEVWQFSYAQHFDLHLVGGWNLVSFPVASENDTPANLFAGHPYSMWKWNPATGGYVKPPDDQPVEIGVGYWINVEENMTVTTSGVPVETFELSLVADSWNLIGFPIATEDDTPENLLENASYYSMWMWNPITGGYVKPPDDQPVENNAGYWLKTDENRIRLPY